MEELERIEILKMMGDIATKWNRKQVKAKKGENKICDALEEVGYIVKRHTMLEEGEISIARKKEKLKENRFPDACAV